VVKVDQAVLVLMLLLSACFTPLRPASSVEGKKPFNIHRRKSLLPRQVAKAAVGLGSRRYGTGYEVYKTFTRSIPPSLLH
jgi:hypothetical protein